MYSPEVFTVTDRELLFDFIEEHDFASLITNTPGGFEITHVPLLLDREVGEHGLLTGHLARANPHCAALEARGQSTAIFHGPHAYISPSWYRSTKTVPTWNYAVVHAHGVPRLLQERERLETVLEELVRKNEGKRKTPWSMEQVPQAKRDALMNGIISFEIPIGRLQGKFKLGQKYEDDDRAGTLEGLEADGSRAASDLAHLLRELKAR